MSIRTVCALFCFIVVSVLSSTGFAEEKPATVEIKKSTADVKDVTVEVKIIQQEVKKESEGKKEKSTPAQKKASPAQQQIEELTINNYGFQAIFINSNVRISGNTIEGEISKGAGEEAEEAEETPSGARAPSQPRERPKKPGKFEETIKDATKAEGLITIYTDEKNKKVFWEIAPTQLEKELLITGVMESGAGAGWAKPGAYLWGYSGKIFVLEEIQNTIRLVQRNTRFTAPSDSTEKAAVEKNYSDSIVAAFPVAATNPEDGGYLVDVTNFLLSDFFQIGDELRDSLGSGYGLDRQNCYVIECKAFPKNIITRIKYAFRSGLSSGNIALPDGRSVQIGALIDIRLLSENPDFETRVADRRIGHFIEAQIDFGERAERPTRFVRNIARWDIRKASPELELSPPNKEIVFWIENTVPEKYRDPIRRGVMEWNKAFRKIGIKDPIVVKDQPDDAQWDIYDARYNTIHWNTSHSLAYSAVAQYITNPRTGEIMNGCFLLEAENLRSLHLLRKLNEPNRMELLRERLSGKPPKGFNQHTCDYSDGLTDHAIFVLTALAAEKGVDCASGEFIDKFVDDCLFALAVHEFGHVLGFRHNFEASTLLPLDQLHNKQITSEKSITSSVMEYLPVNFAPEGVEQGYYFEPTIGPYDYLVVEYAYATIQPATGETERDVLNAIGEKGEQREYAYSTDEDLYGYGAPGIDPLANRYDLGNDPLLWGKQQAQKALDTIPKLPNLIKEGDSYDKVRIGFNYMLSNYFNSAEFALKFLGGQYVNPVIKGGPQDPPPLKPVSAVKQREALNFLVEELMSDKVFQFDPELLQMLAGERWMHWGASIPGPAHEYTLTDIAADFYDQLLYIIFSPVITQRIIEAENLRPPEEVKFSVPEVFKTVADEVWREIEPLTKEKLETPIEGAPFSNKKPLISTYRRMLQRQHVKRMTAIMLQPSYNMPADACTQAWRTLRNLEKDLKAIVPFIEEADWIDANSRDHLAETLVKIRKALDSHMNASIDS